MNTQITVTPYNMNGQEISEGQYSSVSKSLFRAAIDTGLPVITMSLKWCLVGEGNIRLLISKGA